MFTVSLSARIDIRLLASSGDHHLKQEEYFFLPLNF